jgi:hypothetical protein
VKGGRNVIVTDIIFFRDCVCRVVIGCSSQNVYKEDC